jgi:hypothetical protein
MAPWHNVEMHQTYEQLTRAQQEKIRDLRGDDPRVRHLGAAGRGATTGGLRQGITRMLGNRHHDTRRPSDDGPSAAALLHDRL